MKTGVSTNLRQNVNDIAELIAMGRKQFKGVEIDKLLQTFNTKTQAAHERSSLP